MADPSQASSATLSSVDSQDPRLFSQMLSPTQPPAGSVPSASVAPPPAQVHPPVTAGPASTVTETVIPMVLDDPQVIIAGPSTGGVAGIMNGDPPKRRPGRPKGSTKKPVDPNAPPKVKRPVGRPRKDGLPAGSVGVGRPSARLRKAPPGQFASGSEGPSIGIIKWEQNNDVNFGQQSTSGRSSHITHLQPPRNEWTDLIREDQNGFLRHLIHSLGTIAPASTAREAFNTHLLALKPNNGIPYLYTVVRTFWIPCSPAFFSLVTPSGTGRPAQTADRFFYWDPVPLVVMGLPCPSGCGSVLTGHGRIPHGVLAVHDVNEPFYIVGAEYVCTSEKCVSACGPKGRVLSSVDGSVMRALPPGLRREFPAHLINTDDDRGVHPDAWNWSVCGVSNGLWDLVRSALRIGTSPDGVLELIRGAREGTPDEFFTAPRPATPVQESISAAVRPSASMNDSMQVEAALQESRADPITFRPLIRDVKNASRLDFEEEEGEETEQEEPPETPAETISLNLSPNHVRQLSNAQQSSILHQSRHPPVHPQSPVFQQLLTPGHFPAHVTPPDSSLAFSVPDPLIKFVPHAQMTPATAKRLYESTFPVQVGDSPSPARRARHCSKCGSGECKGKGGRSFCVNLCQDCGRQECPGRNSKRPDKTCAEAWRPGETIN